MLIAFNKLFDVICKFRTELGRRTLADYTNVANVYPAGRFDTDSEGLLAAANSMPREAGIHVQKSDPFREPARVPHGGSRSRTLPAGAPSRSHTGHHRVRLLLV